MGNKTPEAFESSMENKPIREMLESDRQLANALRAQEYASLRAEMLQRFSEQSQLIFATTLAATAFFFQSALAGPTFIKVSISSILFQFVLIIISLKLTWTYKQIYRIGSYILVVHELSANRRDHDASTLNRIWWIDCSRSIVQPNKWRLHRVYEAWFVATLGIIGPIVTSVMLLTLKNPFEGTESGAQKIALALLSLVLLLTSGTLVSSSISLMKADDDRDVFVNSLKERIDDLHPIDGKIA